MLRQLEHASHPATPLPELRRLSRSRFHRVRAAVVLNPSTPLDLAREVLAGERFGSPMVQLLAAERARLRDELLASLIEKAHPWLTRPALFDSQFAARLRRLGLDVRR